MDNKEGFGQKVANGINEALGLHENADAISKEIQSSEQELSTQREKMEENNRQLEELRKRIEQEKKKQAATDKRITDKREELKENERKRRELQDKIKEEYIIGMEQAITKLIKDKTQIQAEEEKMRKRGKRYETKNGKLIISNKEMSELDEALGQVTAEISQKMEILKKIISEREKLQLDDETCHRIDKIFHQIETSEQQNVNNEPIGEKTKKKVGEPKIAEPEEEPEAELEEEPEEEPEVEPEEEPEAEPEEEDTIYILGKEEVDIISPEKAKDMGPKPKSKPEVKDIGGGNFANAMRFIRKNLC